MVLERIKIVCFLEMRENGKEGTLPPPERPRNGRSRPAPHMGTFPPVIVFCAGFRSSETFCPKNILAKSEGDCNMISATSSTALPPFP